MVRSSRIVVKLDRTVLACVDKVRAYTGESRGAVIRRALRMLTESHRKRAAVDRYVESYRSMPETTRATLTARKHARRGLANLPWVND